MTNFQIVTKIVILLTKRQKQHMKITIIENKQISLTSFNKKNLHISFIISTFAIEKNKGKGETLEYGLLRI